MELTDIYVMKKETGEIHRVGDFENDSIWVDEEGIASYCNMSAGEEHAAYILLQSACGVIVQPNKCVLEKRNKCSYPISECKNCPVREELSAEKKKQRQGWIYARRCSCTYQEVQKRVVFWNDTDNSILDERDVSDGNEALNCMKKWKELAPHTVTCRICTPFYRNRETGKYYVYKEMLQEWRNRYEGINPVTGLFQYHWHTRYEYIPEDK